MLLFVEAAPPLLCRCDGCGREVDLDECTIDPYSDEVVCRECGEAPLLTEPREWLEEGETGDE